MGGSGSKQEDTSDGESDGTTRKSQGRGHHDQEEEDPNKKVSIPADWQSRCNEDEDWCESFLHSIRQHHQTNELFGPGVKVRVSKEEGKRLIHECKQQSGGDREKFRACVKEEGHKLMETKMGHHENRRSDLGTDSSSNQGLLIGVFVLIVILSILGVFLYAYFAISKKRPPRSVRGRAKQSTSFRAHQSHSKSAKSVKSKRIKRKSKTGSRRRQKSRSSKKSAKSRKSTPH